MQTEKILKRAKAQTEAKTQEIKQFVESTRKGGARKALMPEWAESIQTHIEVIISAQKPQPLPPVLFLKDSSVPWAAPETLKDLHFYHQFGLLAATCGIERE